TRSEAEIAFEKNSVKSSNEAHDKESNTDSGSSMESDDSEPTPKKPKKKQPTPQKKMNKANNKKKSAEKVKSFSFDSEVDDDGFLTFSSVNKSSEREENKKTSGDKHEREKFDHESDKDQSRKSKSPSSRDSVRSNLFSKFNTNSTPRSSGSSNILSKKSRSDHTSQVSEVESNVHGLYVTQAQFEVFATKVFRKLNFLINLSSNNNLGRNIPACPKAISDKVELPAQSIETLEKLDEILEDKTLQEEWAGYLAQLGGKKVSEFLSRAFEKIMVDELCQLTNWTGSAIKAGTKALDGSLIERPYKKTFSNLLNIVSVLCTATKMVIKDATDKDAEEYIKKWLLCFMDRIRPRAHSGNSGTAAKEGTRKSPKKRGRK
ncbi:Putative nickel-responsive regulator, partial [Frankliniella fusca]